jgi:hypothetical protein
VLSFYEDLQEKKMQPIDIARSIDSALFNYSAWVAREEGLTTVISVETKRRERAGIPSASVFGRCPRRREFERRNTDPTNPTDERTENVLFSQGKVVGQMICEAIKRDTNNFSYVGTEVSRVGVDSNGDVAYTGTVDILARYASENGYSVKEDPFVVIEAKFTEGLDLKLHYVYQAWAYGLTGDNYKPFVVVINRFSWRIYYLSEENGVVGSQAYNLETDQYEPFEAWFTTKSFWEEVTMQRSYAADEGTPKALYLSPMILAKTDEGKKDKVEAVHWECVRITSQPHTYLAPSKDGKYQKGDQKPGKGRVMCPFAGICFAALVGKSEFSIGIDTIPFISDDEPF